jgi:hypothetical protein
MFIETHLGDLYLCIPIRFFGRDIFSIGSLRSASYARRTSTICMAAFTFKFGLGIMRSRRKLPDIFSS